MAALGYTMNERERAAHHVVSLERLYVLSIPLAAGIASIRGLTIGGLQYTGFIWLAYLVFGTLLVLRNPDAVRFPVRWWVPFLGLVVVSTAWGGLGDFRQSQAILQWAATMVTGMVASMTIRNEQDLQDVSCGFFYAVAMIVAAFLFFYFGPGAGWHDVELERGFSDRPAAMTLTLIAAVAITHVRRHPLRGALVLATCLALGILTGSRMATAAMLVTPFANPLWRGKVSRIAFVAGVIGLLVVVANTTAFQERFFYGGQGTISDLLEGNIDSSGRYNMWPLLWEETLRRPLIGHGIGTSGMFLAAEGFLLEHPHNEYLRIVFELGFVGGALLFAAVLLHGVDAYRRAIAGGGEVHYAFASICTGLFVLLVMSVTDNPLPYNLAFMHPLFLLIGAAYGAAGSHSELSQDGNARSDAPPDGPLPRRIRP